jgi:hypothetical protein
MCLKLGLPALFALLSIVADRSNLLNLVMAFKADRC